MRLFSRAESRGRMKHTAIFIDRHSIVIILSGNGAESVVNCEKTKDKVFAVKRLQKLIPAALCLALGLTVPAQAQAADELRFPEDGKLKIAVFSDVQTTQNVPKNLLDDLCTVLDVQQPDLVVYLGDQVEGKHPWVHLGDNEAHVRQVIDRVLNPVVDRGIPFAVVFGNHDAQDSGVDKETQMAYYQTFPGCLAVDEGDALPGCGTYHLLYYSADGTRPVVDLYFIDSLEYGENGGYGCVSREQIQWCADEMAAVKESNGGIPVPALCFQHIIVPEIYDTLAQAEKGDPGAFEGKGAGAGKWYTAPAGMGGLREAPCPPDYSNGQFDAWKESGSVVAGFFGHDHKNSFVTQLDGIHLIACPGSTYTSYHDPEARGVRIIELDQNSPGTFTTWELWFKSMRPSMLEGPEAWADAVGRFFGQPHLWELELPAAGLVLILGAIGIMSIRRKRHKTAA